MYMEASVPTREIRQRVAYFQNLLSEAGVGLALLRQTADLFYYTGQVADGFLAVPASGEPVFLVRRPQERLTAAAPVWPPVCYADLRELPPLLAPILTVWKGPLGLELDVIPAALYMRLREQLFAGREVCDVSPLIRRQRMVKSLYEIEQIRQAAAILDEVQQAVPELLKPGLSELELAAALEYRLRLSGHQGLVRLRNWDLEMFYGHVLSGESGLHLSYIDTPSGGLGFSPAFPQGASLKKLAPGEPISIDLAACVNGYVADMTRMYALGDLPAQAWQAFELVENLFAIFEESARPGVMPGDLYRRLGEEVQRQGWEDYFMGQGPDRVRFLGHGVGLELDEFPIIAARFPYPLAPDMVLAFEPKFFLPGIGMVGLEDTGRLTPEGVEWLTLAHRGITVI